MSRMGNFDDVGELDNSSNVESETLVPSDESREKLTPADVRGLSDEDKVKYYRENDLDSLADNREAIQSHREGEGITYEPADINSKNFDRISRERNIDSDDAQNLKGSFAKWSPEAQDDPSLREKETTARHVPEGEKFQITESEASPASGVFVAKDMPATPEDRKRVYALPQENTAENVKEVEIAHPQNVIEGAAAPQPKFEGADGIPREGGGIQTVTDGGYGSGAIRDSVKETSEE